MTTSTLLSGTRSWLRTFGVLAVGLTATLYLGEAKGQLAPAYTFAASSGTFTPITIGGGATAVAVVGDDIGVNITGLPAFTVNGVAYTNARMISNGSIILYNTTAPTTGTYYNPLSTASAGATSTVVIAPFGCDLNSTAGTALRQTIGTENIFQWTGFYRYSTTGETLTFQIRLNTATGTIQFVYGTCTSSTNTIYPQVGWKTTGTVAANWVTDVNNLTLNITGSPTSCSWLNAGTGALNTSTMYINSANPGVGPTSGLTFTWTPPGATPPNPVRTFAAVSGITASGATISWTAPTNGTSYNVQYRVVGTCAWTNWSGNPVAATSVALTGLGAPCGVATAYQVRVQARNAGGLSSIFSHTPTQAGGTGTDGYTATGTFTTTATCGVPTALVSSAIAQTTATISWTAPGAPPSSGYDYYLSTINTAPVCATVPTGSTLAGVVTTGLTGLTSATVYYYWVRSNCGAGVYSNWVAGTAFTTLCNPISVLPWTEGFEGLATVGTNLFPPCWSEQPALDFRSATAATNGYNDPRTGTKYITDTYTATNEFMWSPGFTLTGGTSYDFSFYFAGDGYAGWTGDVFWNATQSGTGATQLGASFIASGTTSSTAYQQVVRTYVPASDGTYYFAIRINATGVPWYIGFDDFKLQVTPVCNDPSAVILASVSATAASFTWTAPTPVPSVGYNWEVRTSGAGGSGGAGLTASGATGSASATTGGVLSPATVYSFYVQSDCGGSGTSTWVGPFTFMTACATGCSYTLRLTDSFGDGWNGATMQLRTGTTVIATYGSTFTTGTLQNNTVTICTGVSYNIYYVGSGTYPGEVGIQVLDAAGTVVHTTAAGGGTVGTALYTWTGVCPTCFPPTALLGSVSSPTTATISWTAAAPVPGVGYDYYVSTVNTAPIVSTIPTGSVAFGTLSVPFTGLTASTTYYFWVRSDCGASDLSPWASGGSFYTGYCIPTTTWGCTDGDVIARVQLNTLDNNSGTGCPSGLLGYSDYTGNGALTTTLTAGTSYTCTVWAGQYAEGYAVWIDYDNDLQFESSERIGFSPGQVAGSGLVGVLGSSLAFPVAIACNPIPGTYRMRVRAMYATNGNAVDPCVNNAYGEVEDYLVTIGPPPPCPTPTALVNGASTATTADASWTAGCVELLWDVIVQNVGAGTPTGGSSPTTNDHASTTYTATGLTGVQELWVRADCGGSTSTWIGPLPIGPIPPNDLCAAANITTLGAGATASVTGWTIGAISNEGGTFSVPGYAAVWEQINLTSCVSNLTISMCGTFPIHTYYWGPLYTNCALTQYVAAATSTNTTTCVDGNITVVYNNIPAGTYYYPVVTGALVPAASYSIAYSTGTASCPANDLVCDAVTVTCGSTTAGTTILATNGGTFEGTTTCGVAQSQPGVWYKILGDGSKITASLCASAWDSKISVYSGPDCNTLTCVGGNDDNGSSCSGLSSSYAWISTAGTMYYIKVYGYSSSSAFSLSVTCCSSPIALPWTENFDAMTYLGTNSFPSCWAEGPTGAWASAATNPYSGLNHLQAAPGGASQTIWTPGFTLTSGESYDFSFYLRGSGLTTQSLNLSYSQTLGDVAPTPISAILALGAATTTTYQLVKRTFVAPISGTWYFALTEGGSAATVMSYDNFMLEVTPPCATPSITNPVTITGSQTGSVSFACGTCTGDLTIEYGPVGYTPGTGSTAGVGGTLVSATIPNTNTSQVISFPSVASYDVYVREDCFGVGYGANAGPAKWLAGDLCLNAIPVTAIPFSNTGTTVGYGDDYSTSPCSNNYIGGNEIVYTFTPGTNQTLALQVSGITSNYAAVHVFTDCPNIAASCFGYDSNGFGTAPLIIDPFTVTAGTTYYIVVSTWPAPQSITSFTLQIIPQPQPPVNDVICEAKWLACGPNGESCDLANWLQGTNYAATMLPTPGDPSCSAGVSRDVWYKAKVGPTGHIAVYTRAASGVNQTDPVVDVFSSSDNTCNGILAPIGCDDDGGIGLFSFVYLSGLTPGQTLFIRLSGYGTPATNLGGTFEIAATRGYQWTGTTNTNWVTTTNWLRGEGGVPGVANDAYIPDVTNDPTVFPGSQSVNSMWFYGSALLNIDAGGGSATLNAKGNITGVLTPGGTSITGSGTLAMNGTTIQTLRANTNITNLTIDNAAGVSLASGAEVRVTPSSATSPGALTLTSGNFNATGGNVRLMSNATGTAYLNDFTGTGTYTGNITQERYATGVGFHYVGSAINNADIQQINEFGTIFGPNGAQLIASVNCSSDSTGTGSPYGRVFEFNESNSFATSCFQWGWNVRSSGILTNGRGYAVTSQVPSLTFGVTGTPNTGSVSMGTLSNSGGYGNGNHILSNPYPSPVALPSVAGFDAAALLWQSSGSLSGTYQTAMPGTLIGAGQGFFKRTGSSGSWTWTNAMRATGNPAFYMESPWYDGIVSIRVDGNGFADLTQIVFKGGATAGWDSDFDAHKHMSLSDQPTLFTSLAGEKLSLNTHPQLEGGSLSVPMGMVAGTAGTFTLKVDRMQGLESGTMVILEDRATGKLIDLRTSGSYTFTMADGDDEDRFVVHFNPDFSGTPVQDEVFGVQMYTDEENLIINNLGEDMIADIDIISAAGQLVHSYGRRTVMTGNNPLSVNGLAAGVYVVRLSSDKGTQSSRIAVR